MKIPSNLRGKIQTKPYLEVVKMKDIGYCLRLNESVEFSLCAETFSAMLPDLRLRTPYSHHGFNCILTIK